MIQFWIPPPVGKLRWPSRFWQWAEIELLGLRLLPNGNHVYRGVWWHILCHRYWAWFSSSLLTSGPCKYLNMYCLDDHWCNVVFDHLSGLLKRETWIESYRYMTPCIKTIPSFEGLLIGGIMLLCDKTRYVCLSGLLKGKLALWHTGTWRHVTKRTPVLRVYL